MAANSSIHWVTPSPSSDDSRPSFASSGLEADKTQALDTTFSKFYFVIFYPGDFTSPPGDRAETSLRIRFPLEDRQLGQKMKAEVEALFILYGREQAWNFGWAIQAAYLRYLQEIPGIVAPIPGSLTFSSADEVTAANYKVELAYREAMGNLEDRSKKIVDVVQVKAIDLAAKRLSAGRQVILSEQARYFAVGENPDQGSHQGDGVAPARRNPVRIKNVAPLVGYLREIQRRQDALAKLADAFEPKRQDLREKRFDPVVHGPGIPLVQALFYILSQAARHVADDDPEAVNARYPEEVKALTQAAYDLGLAVDIGTRHHPILRRIFRRVAIPDSVAIGFSSSGSMQFTSKTIEGGVAIKRLYDALHEALDGALAANASVGAKLKDEAVWRYGPLIDSALAELGFLPSSFEFACVQAHMAQVKQPGLLSTLSSITSAIDLASGFLWPVPGLMVGLACVNAVLSIWERIDAFVEAKENQDVFDAILDPAIGIGSSPNPSSGIASIALSILDIHGVFAAAKLWRAGRGLKDAAAAVGVLQL